MSLETIEATFRTRQHDAEVEAGRQANGIRMGEVRETTSYPPSPV